MKKLILSVMCVIGTGVFGVFGQTKNDDIVKFFRVSGVEEQMEQSFVLMLQGLEKAGMPQEYSVKLKKTLNINDLLYKCIPIYDKYYSHDEIKQLIAFYETPLGKRMVKVTPFITKEVAPISEKWATKWVEDVGIK